MSDGRQEPVEDEFDEDKLIRNEFDSIISSLSLDESAPTTYLDELAAIGRDDRFIAPNPPRQNSYSFLLSAKRAILLWLKRPYHDGDGAQL